MEYLQAQGQGQGQGGSEASALDLERALGPAVQAGDFARAVGICEMLELLVSLA
jgi:hypothetical protein